MVVDIKTASLMEEKIDKEVSHYLLGNVSNILTDRHSPCNSLFGSGCSCFLSEMRLD